MAVLNMNGLRTSTSKYMVMLLFSHKPGNETVNTKDKNIRGIGTHNLACLSHMTIDLASLQSRNGARRVFAGPGGDDRVVDPERCVLPIIHHVNSNCNENGMTKPG